MQPHEGQEESFAWQQGLQGQNRYDAEANADAWRSLSLLVGQQHELMAQHHERQQEVDRRRTEYQVDATGQLFEHWTLDRQPQAAVGPSQRGSLVAAAGVSTTTTTTSSALRDQQLATGTYLPPRQPPTHTFPTYNHLVYEHAEPWLADAPTWHHPAAPADAHVHQPVASGVPGALPVSPTDTSSPSYPIPLQLHQQQQYGYPVHSYEQAAFMRNSYQPQHPQTFPTPPLAKLEAGSLTDTAASNSLNRQPRISVTSSIWPADFATDSPQRPGFARQISSNSVETASTAGRADQSSRTSGGSLSRGTPEQSVQQLGGETLMRDQSRRLAPHTADAGVQYEDTFRADLSHASRKQSSTTGYGTQRCASETDASYNSRFTSTEPVEPNTFGPSASTLAEAARTVDFAAANEALTGRRAASTAAKRSKTRSNGKGKQGQRRPEEGGDFVAEQAQVHHRPPRKGSRRSVADETVHCTSCNKLIATFTLRGRREDMEVPHAAAFRCVECYRAEAAAEGASEEANAGQADATVTSSEPTMSKTISFRKRHNKRVDQSSSRNPITACDVCLRDIAAGSIVAKDGQASIDFHVEVRVTWPLLAVFASLCIPEVFEQQHSIAKSYEEVAMMASRVRSCMPNPRKAKDNTPQQPVPPDSVVLRPNKEVAGFVISEWDMDHGSVFLSVVVPWAMGEVYDATTILIQEMFQHIIGDRNRMSRERQQIGLAPLPEVDETWTMMFFKRDSRMIQHLTKKRGFMFLEDYVKIYPETDVSRFPPIRPIYLPVARQQGWSVMVKRKAPHETEFFPIRRTATSAGVERKIKEQKARSRRAEAAAAESESKGDEA
ncbi:hypothetical protein OIV83_000842 [Microbotryomycetes sp. JL201]|nr:hypothetical protein OIV83_000842 [Microbotryomycetes sp. JL201]